MKTAFTVLFLVGIAALSWRGYSAHVTFVVKAEGPQPPKEFRFATTTQSATTSVSVTSAATMAATSSATATTSNMKKEFSRDDLLALADDKYASGSVPLGDDLYVTTGAKKGYVYLCNVRKDNPGSMVNGPWMHGAFWNFREKISVGGSVSWPNATFSNKISGSFRAISGNGLPIGHSTGVFPVVASDAAAKYDRNPNTISAQSLKKQLPASPKYLETPNCMGGEVGIMLTGVPLFNAFDAGLRDAPAHELQDSCDGHPQGSGQYHYHSLSSCFKDVGVSTVLGYALDGFPITGPYVDDKKYLTTEDLDECHGLTSEAVVDGKKKMTYHYVMTHDFPYSVSCFRGKPVSLMVIQGGQPPQSGMSAPVSAQMPPPQILESGPQSGGTPPAPPQEAISACKTSAQGDTCSFQTPDGMQIAGHCETPPGQTLACVPR